MVAACWCLSVQVAPAPIAEDSKKEDGQAETDEEEGTCLICWSDPCEYVHPTCCANVYYARLDTPAPVYMHTRLSDLVPANT